MWQISQYQTVSVSICRDSGGCLYPVIQRKSSAGILQGLKVATRTGEEKVLVTYQTAPAVLPREDVPACGKRPRHFSPYFFFFFFQFFFFRHSSTRMLRRMGIILPQSCAAFVGLYSLVH